MPSVLTQEDSYYNFQRHRVLCGAMTRPGLGLVRKLTGLGHSGSSGSRNHVCLVLGGTGLLGRALHATVEELEEEASDLDGYHYVFVGSHDADLR